MAVFDRIQSGIPGLDEALDSIRLGDNVVLEVSALEDFLPFARGFASQAIKDHRNLIYIRFGDHEPILEEQPGLKIFCFDPEEGFESFAVKVRERIRIEGRDAFYVFDSLSSLQSVWYTDLMMGNFFCVTCPYLFELDTVAFFPLLRGRHSSETIGRIRDTTQLLLEIYSSKSAVYMHPLKVWNRYSPTMFLPYVKDLKNHSSRFELVESGFTMNQYYKLRQAIDRTISDLHADSYDRFFEIARMQFLSGSFPKSTEDQIVSSMMSRDPRMGKLIRKYMEAQDYFALRERMVGSGCIGGKACGMLVARQILEKELPECWDLFEAHDSWYIGSDVFYTYIVSNDCWNIRIAQRSDAGYYSMASALKEKLMEGQFPANIRERFVEMLDYYGQNPIIVRSSSLQEDGFGNAFAGKYESVFCPNQGTMEERLAQFEQAVRIVYASTMGQDALDYRKQRHLDKQDEQMAILVQRVSGSRFGPYFMPGAAGVGYSYSSYKWRPDMKADAGMLRLVMGLGTRAVDRTQNDYPRLVDLDKPASCAARDLSEKHKFSQRRLDVLDLEKNTLCEIPFEKVLGYLGEGHKRMLLERDWEAESYLRSRGQFRPVWFVSCQKLLEEKTFPDLMKKVLHTLQSVYETPVDIEYTVNLDEQGNFVMDLLQCRPLYVGKDSECVDISALKNVDRYFEIQDSSMGVSSSTNLDYIIEVDPIDYYNYEYNKKYEVARAIGRINRHFGGQERKYKILLCVPGRIGTSSPELGVPVTFADISGFCGVCEIAETRAGYMPELSFGSHMFQDLVEADIFYGAIFQNEKTLVYNPGSLQNYTNIFPEICPDSPALHSMIKVYDVRDQDMYLWHDSPGSRALCGRHI